MSESSPKNFTKYESQRQSRKSLNKSVCSGPTKVQSLALQHLPQKEATELLYESNQTVCVKGDNVKGDNTIQYNTMFFILRG